MNNLVEDDMSLIFQSYPGAYAQAEAPQDPRPRRRRKKSKGTGDSTPKKRKLSEEQVSLLERYFGSEHKLEAERKDRLASELGLDPRQVAVWFQNRRARWKNKKLEEEYSKLKSSHDSVVVEKCHLESEVLRLEEQLSEAKKEMHRLSERVESGLSSNSPSRSSVTVDIMNQPFLGEFGVAEEYDDEDDTLFYTPENAYMQGMEWLSFNLCM